MKIHAIWTFCDHAVKVSTEKWLVRSWHLFAHTLKTFLFKIQHKICIHTLIWNITFKSTLNFWCMACTFRAFLDAQFQMYGQQTVSILTWAVMPSLHIYRALGFSSIYFQYFHCGHVHKMPTPMLFVRSWILVDFKFSFFSNEVSQCLLPIAECHFTDIYKWYMCGFKSIHFETKEISQKVVWVALERTLVPCFAVLPEVYEMRSSKGKIDERMPFLKWCRATSIRETSITVNIS